MKNKKIKQNDALKESLFRAYNACRCINVGQALPDNKESLITNNSCVVGPEQPLLRTSALSNKGFTLIELLVVVLIIGILASVALPQYQLAVGRAQFSTLKSVTKYVAEFAQLYYLSHGTYGAATAEVTKDISSEVSCQIWDQDDLSPDYNKIRCCKNIFNSRTCLYVKRDTGKPIVCLVYTDDANNLAYKLCKKETGNNCDCHTEYCSCGYR